VSLLSEHVDIEAPEHVTFEYELAGIGSRFIAGLIDHLILGLLWALIVVLFVVLGVTSLQNVGVDEAGEPTLNVFSWGTALLLVALFLVTWGYNVFFEVTRGGQTPGKRAMKLRVVKDGGYAVGFLDSLLRNLLRVVDALPPLFAAPSYGVAGVVMLLNRRTRRLGDYVAGTIVIKDRAGAQQLPRPQGTAAQDRLATSLTREEYQIVKRFLSRLDELEPERAREVGAKLARPIMERAGRADEDPLNFLQSIVRGEARAHGEEQQ
jgi:uncharacterized RDD family membrane protein YckC